MATRKAMTHGAYRESKAVGRYGVSKKDGRANAQLRVRLSDGQLVEVSRPRIVRTRRLDGLTLNRDVVRALGRLEARNRDLGKPRAYQLKLDV
jgi:hypothetical protein